MTGKRNSLAYSVLYSEKKVIFLAGDMFIISISLVYTIGYCIRIHRYNAPEKPVICFYFNSIFKIGEEKEYNCKRLETTGFTGIRFMFTTGLSALCPLCQEHRAITHVESELPLDAVFIL